jgi:hypothetical protein
MTAQEHGEVGGKGVERSARELARWFVRLVEEVVEAELRERGHDHDGDWEPCRGGGGLTGQPLAPGATASPIEITQTSVQTLTTAALGAAYVPAGDTPPTQVIWQDHDGEVLVHVDQTQVVMFPGLVLVALALESDETGAGQVIVPFAVGSPEIPAGLVAVTEPNPRGPQTLVDRWGQSAIAAAWQALLDVAHGISLQVGVDQDGARLIPGALSTDGTTLSVTPQARHAADRIAAQ